MQVGLAATSLKLMRQDPFVRQHITEGRIPGPALCGANLVKREAAIDLNRLCWLCENRWKKQEGATQ